MTSLLNPTTTCERFGQNSEASLGLGVAALYLALGLVRVGVLVFGIGGFSGWGLTIRIELDIRAFPVSIVDDGVC